MKTMHIFRMTITWLMAGAIAHGQFAPPAEGPPAFRRDRIPLDAATMSGLAQGLVEMAGAQAMDTPGGRRDAARMLALAIALDPLNADARKLIEIYQQNAGAGGVKALPSDKLARLWQTIDWLEQPEAGDEGQALAALLLDVAAVADPDHPRAKKRDAAESAGWDGWVPPLAAYEASAPRARPDDLTSTRRPRERVVRPPVPDDESAATAAPPLAQAVVRTVLWKNDEAAGDDSWKPALAALQMQATLRKADSANPTPLRIGPRSEDGELDRMSRTVSRLLTARGERVPENLRIRITSPEYEAAVAARMPRPVSAAAAVLASAAVTGREPDALILGEVDSSGQYTLPEDFWRMLKSLGPGDGRKLILPAAAINWLPSMLAMEKAEFFLEHEVLLARNVDELLALSAKQPDETTAAASSQFADIRIRGKDANIRDYLANRFVRQRLGELSQQAPWHASAKMLHTQSVGMRPTTVSRPVLASELRMAIRPMAGIAAIADRKLVDDELFFKKTEAGSLGGIHNKCREDIERLSGVATRQDQDLFLSARALAAALRTLDRNARLRGSSLDYQLTLYRELRSFSREYRKLASELKEEESKAGSE